MTQIAPYTHHKSLYGVPGFVLWDGTRRGGSFNGGLLGPNHEPSKPAPTLDADQDLERWKQVIWRAFQSDDYTACEVGAIVGCASSNAVHRAIACLRSVKVIEVVDTRRTTLGRWLNVYGIVRK